MRHYHEARWTMEGVAAQMLFAASLGSSDGIAGARQLAYLDRCTAAHYPTGTQLICSRDTGHHACGWWKNPDYERCLHLSLCFRDIETGHPRDKDKQLSARWVDAFFHQNKRLLWCEPPYSPEGRKRDIWHYRLFFHDPAFLVPILPRGEVYTKEFTEAGWLSYSDLQAKIAAEAAQTLDKQI